MKFYFIEYFLSEYASLILNKQIDHGLTLELVIYFGALRKIMTVSGMLGKNFRAANHIQPGILEEKIEFPSQSIYK